MKPPRKSDTDRMRRVLRDWRADEQRWLERNGPCDRIADRGTHRAMRIADAEALERVLEYIDGVKRAR